MALTRNAWTIVGGGSILILILGFLLLSLFRSQEEEKETAIRQLATLHAQIALKPLVEAQLQEAKERSASTNGLFRGESAALAGAQLQREVSALIAANKGELRSAQILPTTSTLGFQKIAAQIEFTIPLSALEPLFYAIESHGPYLFVNDLAITGPRGLPMDSTTAADAKLDTRMVVHGFRRRTP